MMFRYFKNNEFYCKCGCGLNITKIDLILKIDELRSIYGKPIILNSSSRCEAHNLAVGGSKSSLHKSGDAVDIRIRGGRKQRYEIIKIAFNLGFTGIGVANTFIHLSLHKEIHEGVYKYS